MLRIQLSSQPGEIPPLPGLPDWMTRLLYARGVRTADDAERFLRPSRDQLLPPQGLSDMDRAVSLLRAARDRGERAAIYGDYDVDGVCASAILRETFGRLGLSCVNYIPDRHREGYGLNTAAVEALAKDCRVLVSVDGGITSVQEVRRAKELGMTVIVTDHHRHGETLPPADAVISPLLGDYPFPYLCGAGVAWKLAWALLGDQADDLMELAAAATVADMVPLTGENRALAALGLNHLAETDRPGLRALMNRAGIQGAVSSDQVAFQIAPRINACGRLASARIALDLLLTRDRAAAEALALRMEALNQQRKEQEAKVLDEALSQVERMDLVETRAIVVSGEQWNSGVVGLAAGRVAEKYAYPTVALAIDGDVCVGSARSAGNVDIHRALSQCADLFDRFGGHRQAAGLTMRREHLAEFTRRLSRAVAEQTGGAPVIPTILCDGELRLGQVTEETVRWLQRLEPYGMGNPMPRFLCRDAEPLSLRAVGAEGRHLKCTFRQGNDLRDGIFFGGGDWAGRTEGSYRLAMTPTVNEFRGKTSAECRLSALQLQPESLRENPEGEALALLRENLSDRTALPLRPEDVPEMLTGQGTLLICRRLNTALSMLARFPQADFGLGEARDPRAYDTVALYATAQEAAASYRRVILCDGDWGEADAYRAACPGAAVYALPSSPAVFRLLSDAFVEKDRLRACYLALKSQTPVDLEDWRGMTGLSGPQGLFALRVLTQIGLISLSARPFRVTVLPLVRRGPEESGLYQFVKKGREDENGLLGV